MKDFYSPLIFVSYIGFAIILIEAFALFAYVKKNGGLKRTLSKAKILSLLDTNFISIGAYYNITENVVSTPKVEINPEKEIIMIDTTNLKIRQKLEAYIESLSSALPEEIVVNKVYMNKQQSKLIVEYQDTTIDDRLKFGTPEEYIAKIKKLRKTELLLDKRHFFELKDYNGILLTGPSGSGKTYLLRQIIDQALIKKWKVCILDYKRTYQVYKGIADVSFTKDEIIKSLEDTLEELHRRQEAMDIVFETNPNGLAIDYGFPVYFVVIEEYLALINSGLTKKEIDHIEEMLLEITTTGRQLNITLAMCLQVSSANILNSSIRANLPVKLAMGNSNRTILETLFGASNVPKVASKLEIGEGLGTYDFDIFTFASPTLLFQESELIEQIKEENNLGAVSKNFGGSGSENGGHCGV